jgi:hypothetical protein
LFHEFIHMKSFSAVQVLEGGDKIKPYRTGISVVSRDGNIKYLENIEEAVVGYLTSDFFEIVLKTSQLLKNTPQSDFENISISRQREQDQLAKLVDILFEKNRMQFSNKEEVLAIFLDAQINGNLFQISKLIKNTFGTQSLKRFDFNMIN